MLLLPGFIQVRAAGPLESEGPPLAPFAVACSVATQIWRLHLFGRRSCKIQAHAGNRLDQSALQTKAVQHPLMRAGKRACGWFSSLLHSGLEIALSPQRAPVRAKALPASP